MSETFEQDEHLKEKQREELRKEEEARRRLQEKKSERGVTQVSFKEYEDLRLKSQKKNKKPFKVPAAVKWVLAVPLGLLCLFGLFYLPYLAFQMFFSQ